MTSSEESATSTFGSSWVLRRGPMDVTDSSADGTEARLSRPSVPPRSRDTSHVGSGHRSGRPRPDRTVASSPPGRQQDARRGAVRRRCDAPGRAEPRAEPDLGRAAYADGGAGQCIVQTSLVTQDPDTPSSATAIAGASPERPSARSGAPPSRTSSAAPARSRGRRCPARSRRQTESSEAAPHQPPSASASSAGTSSGAVTVWSGDRSARAIAVGSSRSDPGRAGSIRLARRRGLTRRSAERPLRPLP